MAPMNETRRSDHAVQSGPSAIHEAGLFVQSKVAAGERIGAVALGPVIEQDRHSLLIGSHHRVVEPPWRYMNHACTPTATLRIGEHDAVLFAARDLEPNTELTIDYLQLPEKLSSPFRCRCPRCSELGESPRVGG